MLVKFVFVVVAIVLVCGLNSMYVPKCPVLYHQSYLEVGYMHDSVSGPTFRSKPNDCLGLIIVLLFQL